MDFKKINKIIKLMEERNLSEFEWEEEGVRVRLKRGDGLPPAPLSSDSSPVPAAADRISVAPDESGAGVKEIVSPMVGTFYRSVAPETPPLVEVGHKVKREDVVCIIEAMKVMNEIVAEMEGEIAEILVQDGQPVEFGQPLFQIKVVS